MLRLPYFVLAIFLIRRILATEYEDIPIETGQRRNRAFGIPQSIDPSDLPTLHDNRPVSRERQPFCFGPLPDLDIAPLVRQSSPLNAQDFYGSTRELCVKSKYGGSSTWNAGFYCHRNTWSGTGSVAAQHYRIASRLNPTAAIMVFCQLRCRCIPLDDLAESTVMNGLIQSNDLEPNDLELFPRWAPMPLWGFRHTSSGFDVMIQPEGLQIGRPLQIFGQVQHLVLPEYFSRPRCYGSPPTWVLPKPFDQPGDVAEPSIMSTFPFNRQLCESGWGLGSRDGNAGGVCKRVNGVDTFMFLDFAAHPSFLDTTSDLGASVRLWCESWCRCGPIRSGEERQSTTVDTIVRGKSVRATFALGNVAVISLSKKGLPKGRHKFYTYGASVGAQASIDAGSSSATSSEPYDDLPWACGKVCYGPARKFCSNTKGIEGCKCIVQSSLSILLELGLDYGAPVAVCLAVSALPGYLMAKDSMKAGLLGGRSLDGRALSTPEALMAEIDTWGCPCNVSYVSRQCCESDDGMVWEEGYLKLGELKMQ